MFPQQLDQRLHQSLPFSHCSTFAELEVFTIWLSAMALHQEFEAFVPCFVSFVPKVLCLLILVWLLGAVSLFLERKVSDSLSSLQSVISSDLIDDSTRQTAASLVVGVFELVKTYLMTLIMKIVSDNTVIHLTGGLDERYLGTDLAGQ